MFNPTSTTYMSLLFSPAWCSTPSAPLASAKVTYAGSSAVQHKAATSTSNPLQGKFTVQQSRDITGTVTEASGSGLPGVSVVIEGTSLGTVTDADGKFSINVPSDESVLIFSFIGYVTQKVSVGAQAIVNVTL